VNAINAKIFEERARELRPLLARQRVLNLGKISANQKRPRSLVHVIS
jgi:hypothetical protein